MDNYRVENLNCLEFLKSIPDASVDAVITDPPYAEVDRDYGRISESDWANLMHEVVFECKRVLKPSGSAMFVIQPNFEKIGTMRTWVWDFMSWSAKNWNMVQDVYCWNYNTMPGAGVQEKWGLLRGSLKYLVWLGSPDCYKNQKSVLLRAQDMQVLQRQKSKMKYDDERRYSPSGHSRRHSTSNDFAIRNGGITPTNVLPIIPTSGKESAGAQGHGAGTPNELVRWWIRYITKENDVILDPFLGSGTTGIQAIRMGRKILGCEKETNYYEIALKRISDEHNMRLDKFLE